MAIRKKRIQVVLSEQELEQFRQYAESQGISMSEILRDYIKSLTKPSSEGRGFKPNFSVKPDFTTMTTTELRVYVLEHRDDEEALHVYLDKLHAENPSSRVYRSEDDVTEAIAEYLKDKRQKKA